MFYHHELQLVGIRFCYLYIYINMPFVAKSKRCFNITPSYYIGAEWRFFYTFYCAHIYTIASNIFCYLLVLSGLIEKQ